MHLENSIIALPDDCPNLLAVGDFRKEARPYGAFHMVAAGAVVPTAVKHSKPLAHTGLDKDLGLTHRVQRTVVELREDLQDPMAGASAAVNGASAHTAGRCAHSG
jgi:hypothetical protein